MNDDGEMSLGIGPDPDVRSSTCIPRFSPLTCCLLLVLVMTGDHGVLNVVCAAERSSSIQKFGAKDRLSTSAFPMLNAVEKFTVLMQSGTGRSTPEKTSASSSSVRENSVREKRYRAFQTRREEILIEFSRRLEAQREQWLSDGNGEAVQAAETALAAARDTEVTANQIRLPGEAQGPVTGEPIQFSESWKNAIREQQIRSAGEMYRAAREALRNGFPTLAFRMIGDVVRIDSDHRQARSILGYQLFSDPERKGETSYFGEWVSPFEAKMRGGAKPQIYDSRFGWIPAASLTRYEQGLRPWKGEWVSEEKEAELRRDFRNAWEVRSEHFLVKTNTSLETGVQLSANLEVFYHWLQQNLPGFFDSPGALQQRFDEATRRDSGREKEPMLVNCFATREEYLKKVRGKVPPNTETNGLYWQPDQTSFFYIRSEDDPEGSESQQGPDLSTLFHEATHQILDTHTARDRLRAAEKRRQALRQKKRSEWVICETANFWLIEGLACYFESFEIIDGEIRVGRPDYIRFEVARERLTSSDPKVHFFVPFRKFFGIGKDGFQQHPNAAQLYTQASGTAHFLMHYDGGVYRDDLVAFLKAVYVPDAEDVLSVPSFDKISGVPFEQLENQYRAHMQMLTEDESEE